MTSAATLGLGLRSAVLAIACIGLWIQGIWQGIGALVLGLVSYGSASFENVPIDAGPFIAVVAAALAYSAVVLR